MTDKHANEIRLYANEIMYQLYTAGKRDQLDLLRMYADIAIKEIDGGGKSEPDESYESYLPDSK